MATSFSQSSRCLDQERNRRSWPGWVLLGLVLGVWSLWFFLAEVSLYEVSPDARLETDRDVHAVESVVGGPVLEIHMVLGDTVRAGDVLLQIDPAPPQHALAEATAIVEALSAQLGPLQREVDVIEEAQRAGERASQVAVREATALGHAAEAEALAAESEARRVEGLTNAVTPAARERAALRARADRSAARAATKATQRELWDRRAQLSEVQLRTESLRTRIAQIRGQLSVERARVDTLREAVRRCTVVAPVDGKLGDVMDLHPGTVLAEGERIASIIPEGDLRVIAFYPPASALGRIQEGQVAHLRLHGFPWTRYGAVAARVRRVASEARDRKVRVELAVVPSSAVTVPMEHGLPGTVEVEVDRVSPAELLLRSAGLLLTDVAPTESPLGPAP